MNPLLSIPLRVERTVYSLKVNMMTDSTERLYTRILKSPYINKKDKKQIALAIPIVCDSVSEYFFEVSAKEYWDIREFPIIVPVIQPFAFFDFTPPQKITSVEFGVRNWNQGGDELLAWGIYMTTDDLLDESRKAPVATRVEYNRNLLAAVDKTLAQFAPELYAAQQARDERRIEEEFFRLPLFHRLTATTLIARWNRLATRTTAGEVAHLHAAIRAGEVPRWEIEASLWQDFGGSNLLKMYRWEYSVWDKGPLFFGDSVIDVCRTH
jgi:hypothetical protein